MTIILHDRYDQTSAVRIASSSPVGPRREIPSSSNSVTEARTFAGASSQRRITWADDDLMSAISSTLTPINHSDSARQFFRRLSSTIAKRRR